MNKFTKLILTSAVFATSGFATTNINADTVFESGANVKLENEMNYIFADGTTLHNYTTIQGPITDGENASFNLASGASSANIIHYKD